MCARVKLTTGTIPKDGCYKEKVIDGYQREMCVCRSSSGVYPPCNGAKSTKVVFSSILMSVVFIKYMYLFLNNV